MALETGVTYIEDMVTTNPVDATDNVSEGDDHIRLIKTAVQGSFPSLGAAAVTKTAAEINDLTQSTSGTATDLTLDTSVSGTAILDEDDMASDSATKLATQQSIKAYIESQKPVFLDTPEQLVTASVTKGSWTTSNSLTLGNASAVTAILRVYIDGGLTASDGSITSYLRKTGTALAADRKTRVAHDRDRESVSSTLGMATTAQATVNLDVNSDFDWYSDTSGTGAVSTDIVLVGYYV